MMKRPLKNLGLLMVLYAAAQHCRTARADDELNASLSQLITRIARTEALDQKLDFSVGPLAGHLEAVEPEQYLSVEVLNFELADDVVRVSLTAKGRLRVTGRTGDRTDIYALVDAQVTIVAEARFVQEGEEFFIVPSVKDATLELAILELLPAEIAGSEDFLAGLAVALFKQHKEKILTDANQRIGKRRL